MPTVTVIDENTAGTRGAGWAMHIAQERISVRELIRRRILQEVTEFNAAARSADPAHVFRGLVQPVGSNVTSGGYRVADDRPLDWAAQYDLAVEAFARNGFVVIVGDRQVDGLDTVITLTPRTEVTFLRLVATA